MAVRMTDAACKLVLEASELPAVPQAVLAGVIRSQGGSEFSMKTRFRLDGLYLNHTAHRPVSVKDRRGTGCNAEAPDIGQGIEIRYWMSHQSHNIRPVIDDNQKLGCRAAA